MSKVILYITISANGMIATANDEAPWSEIIWSSYYDFIKSKGNIVVGHKTYELMKEVDEFTKLAPAKAVVVSSQPLAAEENIRFVTSAREAVDLLQADGFSEIIVGGGSKLNQSFLQAKLLDELIIDVEPIIIAGGIPLFAPFDANVPLELLQTQNLSDQTIRLHYKVKK